MKAISFKSKFSFKRILKMDIENLYHGDIDYKYL